MQVPDRTQALRYIEEAEKHNAGPWVAHSFNVARAARRLAEHLTGLDPDAAYALGLLHDIGRRAGVTGMRHVYDGYRFMLDEGYPDAARICLTHSFPVKDTRAGSSEWDCTEDELAELQQALDALTYDDYDRLLQLGDAISLPEGFCLLEVRIVDVLMRYRNFNDFTLPKWEAYFEIMADFNKRIGRSLYDLLPGIVETTLQKSSTP